jgi:hypothetical protein
MTERPPIEEWIENAKPLRNDFSSVSAIRIKVLGQYAIDLELCLKRIAEIIETVDHRCQFGAIITPTLQEMEQEEISEIYKLASDLEKAS